MINPYTLPDARFCGNCLTNNNISAFRKVTNLYIYHTLDTWSRCLNVDFTLDNCLSEAVIFLTKNYDSDKYRYSSSGIGFDARSQFSLPARSWDKYVIIFGVDNSSSLHVDNKKKNIIVFDESATQGLDDTTITADC